MKKLGLLVMAFVLMLGISQCKKENTTASNDEGMKVSITLNVNGGNVSRVVVTPETGVVTFETGDVLYVASGGHYVGTMTYNSIYDIFSGEITEPTEGQKLQFYFLGNKTPEFNSDNTECSVVISGQATKLSVISYAPSRENYEVGRTAYNATLLNKCALVKFDVTTASESTTSIFGMNNKVMVDFATNEFTYSQTNEGIITLPEGSGERWAILLPQEEVTEAEAIADDGSYTGTCGTIPTIAENDYLTSGIDITVETPVGPVGHVGIINGIFTINGNGDQVWFSQGNLQHQASTNTWRFAENQWDYVGGTTDWNGYYGNVEGSNNHDISPTYSGWIDLFCWGTSGYNHGAICYQPWSTSVNNSDYYAYGEYSLNLYDQNGQADWGYNAISNGGNQENSGWRTLTQSEWEYLFHSRSTTSGIRFVKGKVNGVNGIILLPDNWESSIYALNNANGGQYDSNTINADDWTNVLEANGAVFLPAAGTREGTSVNVSDSNSLGYYWSASASSDWARCIRFYYYGVYLETNYDISRNHGLSVRLVRSVE